MDVIDVINLESIVQNGEIDKIALLTAFVHQTQSTCWMQSLHLIFVSHFEYSWATVQVIIKRIWTNKSNLHIVQLFL